MTPTLVPGDIVLASPLPYLFAAPTVNDLVMCHDPRDGRIVVKRIKSIDNNLIKIVGDNPAESTDSRHFGFISRRDIIGKVVFIITNS